VNGDFLGGGLVFAIAAVLWLAYLVPTWLRRRHFDATEKNAVRLQQTIRALVETGGAPSDVIQAEASARGVLEQQKVLRKAEAEARAQLRKAAAAEMGFDERAAHDRHRRRTQRAIAAIVLFVAVVAFVLGITLITMGGSSLLLWISAAVAVADLLVIRALAQAGRPKRVAAPAHTQEFIDYGYAQAPSRQWTPTPLPRPLHLSTGSMAAATVSAQRAAEQLRLAGAEEALIARVQAMGAGQPAPARTATPVPTAPVAPAASSRFAAMGIVESEETEAIDLDAALRRRRVG